MPHPGRPSPLDPDQLQRLFTWGAILSFGIAGTVLLAEFLA